MLISVKSVVSLFVEDSHVTESTLVGGHSVVLLLLSLIDWEEVDGLVVEDFSLLDVPHVGAEDLEGLIWCHGEGSVLNVASGCAVLRVSEVRHLGVYQFVLVWCGSYASVGVQYDVTCSYGACGYLLKSVCVSGSTSGCVQLLVVSTMALPVTATNLVYLLVSIGSSID